MNGCTHDDFHIHLSYVNSKRYSNTIHINKRNHENNISNRIESIKYHEIRVLHNYSRLLHAVAVIDSHPFSHSVPSIDLINMPCVSHISRDMKKHLLNSSHLSFPVNTLFSTSVASNMIINNTRPWGIDRLDQRSLPLDGIFSTDGLTGAGVDVYLLDTGLDSNHKEFQQSSQREVKNIYDGFAETEYLKFHPKTDNDGQLTIIRFVSMLTFAYAEHGHGTHTAAIVGGSSVGVAPNANIYMCRILDEKGQGSSSVMLEALEEILRLFHQRKRPTVLSLSLGGECDSGFKADDCAKDPLVMAIERLTTYGIVSTVAAGNDRANGCFGSPNAASSAINVGATNSNDEVAHFSDIGKCIMIILNNRFLLFRSYIYFFKYSY
jgi:subtilisin family serine protease